MLLDLTKNNINEFIHSSSGYVLVEFYSPTCRSCQSLIPILEDISDEYYGVLKVYKINSENESDLADLYDVFSLPTTILFKDATPLKEITGLHSYDDMIGWLDL